MLYDLCQTMDKQLRRDLFKSEAAYLTDLEEIGRARV